MAAWRVLNMLTQCEHLDSIIYSRVGGVWVSLVTPVIAMWGNAT